MEVYALYGKSGTGKSYQAVGLCRKYGIDAIIDDGLLIVNNQVAAGISAKRQATQIGAVKTALFTDEEHRRSVAEKIAQEAPERILILGTSENMVEKISARLELPPIAHRISIEEITTEEEREEAHRQRHELGKHVIPAPTFQIKRQFSGYFIDPLRILRNFNASKGEQEKTVVRPAYSYLGGFDIADKVIADIVRYAGKSIKGVHTIPRVAVYSFTDGVKVQAAITVEKGTNLLSAAEALQAQAAKQIEHMTAFNVDQVDVEIRALK